MVKTVKVSLNREDARTVERVRELVGARTPEFDASQLREAPAVPADCRTPRIGIEVPDFGIMRSYQL